MGKVFSALLIMFVLLSVSFLEVQAESNLIEDPQLDKVIRASIGKSSGNLTADDLLKVTSIYAYQKEGIKSLKGLEFAKNLNRLIVSNQPLTRIDEVAGLSKLTFVDISGTQVSDLSPLQGLTQLGHLSVSGAKVKDLTPLLKLTRLSELFLAKNEIEDITPLIQLKLVWLDLADNKIDDISPLLIHGETLEHVFLSRNNISDISYLVLSERLKHVYVEGNPLDAISLKLMKSFKDKAIDVKYDDKLSIPPISVKIDGQPLTITGAKPLLIKEKTFVPLRDIFEALGAAVQWNQTDNSVTATKGKTTVWLQIGSRKARVNGTEVALEVEPQLVGNFTMVPVRFISEALGANVKWDGTTQTVSILTTTESSPPDVSEKPEDIPVPSREINRSDCR
ncbi:stalk domain-containing protein [Paenibacillus qinlingensis]|uniref:Copper amine oxidase-like N-terminal domain-containing protein n=1 Tax=Paenibacillus qinlingensis TaxID=1837343 RepID=A0ABU1NNP0_9BACL|nr:stalk domain-containing protein [Paenibacillus qinlingensis]MDR6549072.1 hypothetical protein [Paenibacillus qinlingensis]